MALNRRKWAVAMDTVTRISQGDAQGIHRDLLIFLSPEVLWY